MSRVLLIITLLLIGGCNSIAGSKYFRVKPGNLSQQTVRIGESFLVDLSVKSEHDLNSVNVYVDGHKSLNLQRRIGRGENIKSVRLTGAVLTLKPFERYLAPGQYKLVLNVTDRKDHVYSKVIAHASIDKPSTDRKGSHLDELMLVHKNYLNQAGKIPNNPSGAAKFEWLNSTAGSSRKVPKPFRPITVSGNELSIWGRRIVLGDSGLPKQIYSQGHALLTSPVRLNIPPLQASDSVDTEFSFFEKAPDRVGWKSVKKYRQMVLEIDGEMEFDGFIRYRLSIRPRSEFKIDHLALQIPFDSSVAKYYNRLQIGTKPLTKGNSDLLFEKNYAAYQVRPGLTELPFSFQYSVLNESVGLLFAVESFQSWIDKDQKRSFSIEHNPSSTVFSTLFAGQPTVLRDQELTSEFGLQVLPIKPLPTASRLNEFNAHQWSTADAPFRQKYDQKSRINHTLWQKSLANRPSKLNAWDQAQKDGLKTLVVHQNWTEIQGYPGSYNRKKNADLKRLTQLAHDHGMKVAVYIGLEISENAPEWQEFAKQFVRMPLLFGRRRGSIVAFRPNAANRAYSDFLTYKIRELIRDADIDGVFLDMVPEPLIDMNTDYGRGYRDNTGELQGTLNYVENRDLMKRIYSLFHVAPKQDGIVIGHVNGPLRPGHAFCDYILAGEAELYKKKKSPAANLSDLMNPTEFRALYNVQTWGVPLIWLSKEFKGGFSMGQNGAVTLLHNTMQRTQWPHFIQAKQQQSIANPVAEVLREWRVWKLFTHPQLDSALWYPYWSNKAYLSGLKQDVYSSFWVIPGQRILAVVSNLSRAQTSVSLSYNVLKLGFSKNPATIRDALSKKEIARASSSVEMNLNPESYRIIELIW